MVQKMHAENVLKFLFTGGFFSGKQLRLFQAAEQEKRGITWEGWPTTREHPSRSTDLSLDPRITINELLKVKQ